MSLQDRLSSHALQVMAKILNRHEANKVLATRIEQDLLALIGEDDDYDAFAVPVAELRNQLRAELRTAITAYCKGEK